MSAFAECDGVEHEAGHGDETGVVDDLRALRCADATDVDDAQLLREGEEVRAIDHRFG